MDERMQGYGRPISSTTNILTISWKGCPN